jgi:hypothetical protein
MRKNLKFVAIYSPGWIVKPKGKGLAETEIIYYKMLRKACVYSAMALH